MPHDVFISYSSQDKPTAEAICHALEAEGIRCWIAHRDARPGRLYQGSIVRAIRDARAMVLVFSDGANASAHVTREVAIASDANKPVVPFRVEAAEMSDELYYYISSVHWLDAITPPLERHIERLVQAVKRLLHSHSDGSTDSGRYDPGPTGDHKPPPSSYQDSAADAEKSIGADPRSLSEEKRRVAVSKQSRGDASSTPPEGIVERLQRMTVAGALERSHYVMIAIACVVIAGFVGLLISSGDPEAQDSNVSLAKVELRGEQYDRVLELTAAAIETNPDNQEAYFLRGEAYRMKAENTESAEARAELLTEMTEAYERSLELGLDASDVTNRLQIAWGFEMNRGASAFRRAADDPTAYEDAAASFGNAITVQPDSSAGYLNQGLVLLASGESAAAAEPLQMAIDKGAESAEAYIYLGRIYLASDRTDDALNVLEQGRLLFPENGELQTELLNVYVRAGQTERAIGAYEARIAAEPQNPLYRYNYGSLLLQAERYDEAIEQLEQAVELDPEKANAYYNLGAAYQNKAASYHERISELRDTGGSQAELRAAINERGALLQEALPNLERARELTLAAGGDGITGICKALFQVYASLGKGKEAQGVAECAGINLN